MYEINHGEHGAHGEMNWGNHISILFSPVIASVPRGLSFLTRNRKLQ